MASVLFRRGGSCGSPFLQRCQGPRTNLQRGFRSSLPLLLTLLEECLQQPHALGVFT